MGPEVVDSCLDGLLPSPEQVRAALARTEERANILRGLLALYLRRDHTPEQRARVRRHLAEGTAHAGR